MEETAIEPVLKTRGSKGRNKYTDLNQVTKDSKQKSEHTVLMYVYLYVTESTVRFEHLCCMVAFGGVRRDTNDEE